MGKRKKTFYLLRLFSGQLSLFSINILIHVMGSTINDINIFSPQKNIQLRKLNLISRYFIFHFFYAQIFYSFIYLVKKIWIFIYIIKRKILFYRWMVWYMEYNFSFGGTTEIFALSAKRKCILGLLVRGRMIFIGIPLVPQYAHVHTIFQWI